MRGFLFYAALIALTSLPAEAAGNEADDRRASENSSVTSDNGIEDKLDSVIVSASRAGKTTPVTYTMVSKKELRSSNPINSLPMLLNLQPSVVAVNEGGTGIGYSKMSIRGSKGSQINVTLNGITLNDAESQEVFWVNIPALTNIINSVQLQRGLGTSANGSGAFGASVNMSTASVSPDPHVAAEIAGGSYNTFMATVAAGTGLTRSGVYFDVAYSRNYTDGYIRNAKANVQSAFAALGWMNATNSIKLTYLMGDQHTGITWNGIDLETYETDRRYNSAGEYTDQFGNLRYYDNETDNYTQHHIQLNYTHQFPKNVVWSTTFNYTKGDGYYENYKAQKKFSKYNFPELPPVPVIDPVTGQPVVDGETGEVLMNSKSDFIVRKAMDNHYFVLNSDVRYAGAKVNFTGGINLSRYDGDHIGKVLWNSRYGDKFDYDAFNDGHKWYLNNGLKQEINVFARAEYTPLPWMTAYADLQYRGVSLKMEGPEDDGAMLDYSTTWNFFNPRAGLTFNWTDRNRAYISAALGHREPGRSDLKEVILSWNSGSERSALKPERMVDIEIGYVYTAEKIAASANFYFMEYWNMLLETGRLSDVGYAIKDNVGRSYRRGIELAAAWETTKWMKVDANLTLSLNKIKDYSEYVSYIDNPDDWNELDKDQKIIGFGTTDMLMSPSVVGMLQLTFRPFATVFSNSLKTTTLSINGKYVGRQYMDNTASKDRSIPGYFVSNLSLMHEFNVGGGKLGISGHINNLLNNFYYADGGAYKNVAESDGRIYYGVWVYPQAPVNFMLKLSYRF